MTNYSNDRWVKLLFLIIAAPTLANSIWMLAAPLSWYEKIPADVPDFGPFNVHFVRDFACGYVTIGVALIWGYFRPSIRFTAAVLGALYFGAHAMIHVFDTARGHVDASHWLTDLPLTYLPVILLGAAVLSLRKGSLPRP